MKQLLWIKTKVGLFGDVRIMTMLRERRGETYFLLWCFLRDAAASLNQGGAVRLSPSSPLTSRHIGAVLGRRSRVIDEGLAYLEAMGFIARRDDGTICLSDWDDMQDFDKAEQRREASRRRSARYRKRCAAARAEESLMAEDYAAGGEEGPAVAGADEGGIPAAPEEPGRHDGGQQSSSCAAYYASLFGAADGAVRRAVAAMEDQWGKEALCRAMDAAYERGVVAGNLNYIRTILKNRGSRKEGDDHGYARPDEYVSRLLRQADEYTARCGGYCEEGRGGEADGSAGPPPGRAPRAQV